VAVYDAVNDTDELKEVVSNYVCDMVRPAKLGFDNGSQEEGSTYRTFHIDSHLYLEELKIEAMLRGVRFVQKKFHSLQEVLALKEKGVWNCTNEGSARLFEDNNFQKQQFVFVDFEEETGSKDMVLRGRTEEDEFEVQCVGRRKYLIIKAGQ
jgi:hypothetical protein